MTTLDTPHEAPSEVRLCLAAGGELLIEQFGATTYDLYVTDATGERAMVRITRATLTDLLELVGSILITAVRGGTLNESVDMIDIDDELEYGIELYAAYCDEDPDEATPQGLQVEAISPMDDRLIIVSLAEFPQLQLQLATLLLLLTTDADR